jgi:hypothetical protein
LSHRERVEGGPDEEWWEGESEGKRAGTLAKCGRAAVFESEREELR